jgi:DNA-binding GntR family transcriptional regulator
MYSGRASQALREDVMATQETVEPLLDERAVARITGMSVASVRRWT